MARAAGPALSATEAYCIIDADTGLVLAQQNMDEELHPASITKVMTLGLACEKAQGQWDGVKPGSHPRGRLLPRGYGFQPHRPAGGGGSSPDGCPLRHHDGQRQRRREPAGRNISADGTIAGGVAAMNAQVAELGLAAHPLRQPPRHQRQGPLHQLLRYGADPALGADPAGL